MKRFSARASLLALLTLTLSSCSTEMPSIEDVQTEVSKQVEAQGLDRPDNVSCSGVASLSAGMTLVCDLIYEDQRNRSAEVGMTRVGTDGIGMDIDIIDDRR